MKLRRLLPDVVRLADQADAEADRRNAYLDETGAYVAPFSFEQTDAQQRSERRRVILQREVDAVRRACG